MSTFQPYRDPDETRIWMMLILPPLGIAVAVILIAILLT